MMPNVIPIGSAWHGASPEDWDQFSLLLGLTRDLLPVVSNPEAVISPQSGMRSLGKTPSIYNGERQVVGLAKWTQRETTMAAVETWSHERDYGICLQTREVRALDVDIDDPDEAAEVARAIYDHLVAPVRSRANSAKFLQAFRMPGDYGKRRIKTAHGMIEFLATGQQFVAVGRHPSGVKYEWTWPDGEDFPTLSPAEFEALWAALQAEFGVEPDDRSAPSTRQEKLHEAITTDPVANYLYKHNLVLGQGRDAQLFVECPWHSEHSVDSGITATAYFPAHTRGYPDGGFRCLHASHDHKRLGDYLEAVGYRPDGILDGLANLEIEAPAERTPDHPYHVITATELCDRPLPGYWIKHVLPKGEVAVVYGESGSGKSFFVLDLVMAVARGEPWREHRVHKGSVVYLAAEGQGAFNKRVKAYALYHDLKLEDVPMGFIMAAPNLREQSHAVALIEQIKAHGPVDIVVVDTLAQVMPGGDENSSEAMGNVLRNCKLLHKQTGALVLLVHHSGKDPTKGARGWSGLKGALDVEIEITRQDDMRAARLSKMKDDVDGQVLAFSLETVKIGVDEDLDDITSCCCKPEAAMVASKKYKPTGAGERAVLDALEGIYDSQTSGIEEGAITDAGLHLLPESLDGRERRPETLRRSARGLAKKGVIGFDAVTHTYFKPIANEQKNTK